MTQTQMGTDFLEGERADGRDIAPAGEAVRRISMVDVDDEPLRQKRPLAVARRMAAAALPDGLKADGRRAVSTRRDKRKAIPQWMHFVATRLEAGESGVILCATMVNGRYVLRDLYEGLKSDYPDMKRVKGGLRLEVGAARVEVVNHISLRGRRPDWGLLGTAVDAETQALARERVGTLVDVYEGGE